MPLNSVPQVNAVVVFRYTHVAIVTGISGTTLHLIEANKHLDGKITTRDIEVTDSSIKGFYVP